MIGGILSSPLLTLLVLPALYRLAHARDEQRQLSRIAVATTAAPLQASS